MRTFRLVPLLALPLLIVARSTSAIQPTIAPSGQPRARWRPRPHTPQRG